MSKWVTMLLNDGKAADGSDVIPSDVIRDVHTAHMTFESSSADMAYLRPEAPVSYTHFSYGLAWRIGYYRGNYCPISLLLLINEGIDVSRNMRFV
jgi:hypothetical protein